MRTSFILMMLGIALCVTARAQNSAVTKWIIPHTAHISISLNPKGIGQAYKLEQYVSDETDNFLSSVLTEKHFLQVRNTLFVSAAFSYPDLLKNTISGMDANLLNTYDDSIPELFKDTPSLVKLKFIIPVR